MSYLAVDPGDTTGVAHIGASGELLDEWLVLHEELPELLMSSKLRHVSVVIVEDFALLPQKAQAVSQTRSRHMKASRGIGVLEMFTAIRGIELAFRDPRHWRTGLSLAGIPPEHWPKNHSTGHAKVAYGLGMHWLVDEGLVDSRIGPVG